MLLDHIVAEEQTIDHVVYHGYADRGGPGASQAYVADHREIRGLVEAAKDTGLIGDPEIWMNEWGIDATSFTEPVRNAAGAAFIASALTTFTDMGLDVAHYYSYQDDKLEGDGDSKNEILRYGLLDDQDNRRPTWQAFRMFHDLGDRRVAASPVNISLGQRQEWGALATLSDDSTELRVLLRNSDAGDAGDDLIATLDIDGFTPTSWSAEDLGSDTNDAIVTSSGTGTPTVSLPPNHVTLLTLTGATTISGTTGWISPTSSVAVTTAGDGDGWETDIADAYDNGSGAAHNDAGVGDAHELSGFSATIPSGSTVTGIDVRTDWWVSAANWSPQLDVSISTDNGSTWTVVGPTPVGATVERADRFYGLAGSGVSPANVKVRVAARCTGNLCGDIDWWLDWVAIRINHN